VRRRLAAPRAPVPEGGDPLPRLVCALGPDTAGDLLAGLIGGATGRLDLAVYEAGPSYAGLIAAAAERGARVRLLLDGHAGANATTARRLAGCGAEVRVWSHRPGAEGHWKLITAGTATLAVGSGNLISRDAPHPGGRPGTREWWLLVEDAPRLAARARAAQDAAWAVAGPPPAAWTGAAAAAAPPVGVPRPTLPALELAVAEAALELAVGGTAVAALLVRHLAAAGGRALCTVPYAHPHVRAVATLLDALAGAAARGADARLLLGAVPEPADLAGLRSRGLEVRVMDPARSTTGHAKGAVVDGVVVAGSANWSGAGLGANLEAALAVDHPAAAGYYAAAFDRDWAASG
jgi:phosphatidylserine/phosphatidylglycerophosphate/cardiolipin synthase-like enzyme